jgi:hypothetical protein
MSSKDGNHRNIENNERKAIMAQWRHQRRRRWRRQRRKLAEMAKIMAIESGYNQCREA